MWSYRKLSWKKWMRYNHVYYTRLSLICLLEENLLIHDLQVPASKNIRISNHLKGLLLLHILLTQKEVRRRVFGRSTSVWVITWAAKFRWFSDVLMRILHLRGVQTTPVIILLLMACIFYHVLFSRRHCLGEEVKSYSLISRLRRCNWS
jgi:hypothetical protein